jgi:hypothetical protein
VLLAIECPSCGQYTERALPWLNTAASLPCDGCGAEVDLGAGEARDLIDAIVRLNARLDAEFPRPR